MRYHTAPADVRFYAGVDLHARSLFLVVLDRDGQTRFSRNLAAAPQPFLHAVAPFRDGLVVGRECPHRRYWLADCCREEDVAFALGHARGMKAVHGNKTKGDRHDAEAIARLVRGGNFPPAYAYPKERRGLRDPLRARLRLVRRRAELYGHVHTARRQANPPPASSDVRYKGKRTAALEDVADPFVRRRVETHPALLEPLDTTIRRLEAEIEDAARRHYPAGLAVPQSTPGVGPVPSRTILPEIDAIGRFDTRRQFCPYARPCGAARESAGKRVGVGDKKAGNAWLRWAFSEAAAPSAQKDERVGKLLDRLASRMGKPKAYSASAHKPGRAFYHMLHAKEVFDAQRFVRRRAAGRPASRSLTGA
jgi:transposase